MRWRSSRMPSLVGLGEELGVQVGVLLQGGLKVADCFAVFALPVLDPDAEDVAAADGDGLHGDDRHVEGDELDGGLGPVERRTVQDDGGGGDGGEGPLGGGEVGRQEEAGDAVDDEDGVVEGQQRGRGQDAGEVNGDGHPPSAHGGGKEGADAENPGEGQGGEREGAGDPAFGLVG
ncbi:hypothetical protein ACFSTC_27955 [Nonomuraea ferruginea]